LRQHAQRGQSTHIIQQTVLVQPFRQRHGIQRLALLGQLRNRAKDQAVITTVEILLVYRVSNRIPCTVIQHQPAQHGLLGLDRVWRHLESTRVGLEDVC
jgi:hypothetical protein